MGHHKQLESHCNTFALIERKVSKFPSKRDIQPLSRSLYYNDFLAPIIKLWRSSMHTRSICNIKSKAGT